MPSFLSKVFGRKKDDKESPRRVEDTDLLDGKFEAVSPSATKFPEVVNERQPRDKDSPFNVFRPKSRPSSPEPKDKRAEIPHLSLNLPGLKDEEASRKLGAVFEADPESQILSEEVIGSRRLNPLETLILVRACSEAIIARGLETLGVMHPHWHSASPEEQRKLISLFLKSLAPNTSIATLSPTPTAIATAFDSEISSTQSPYDIAAVLRWGLRHLRLEGTSFGKEDTWYKTFFDAERSAGYPPNGYSTTLAPLLPTSHLELLTATLEVFSSLAAHAEANGISGSKLSKFFGLWLLTIERAQEDDDWSTFYARWERTGRMLEHMFLSRIRDDATESRMPTRLLELIQRYPYQTDPNADLLARPRFSTIQYNALFVRIETELSATTDQPSHHPLWIISEAFKAEASPDAGEHVALWESIRKAGASSGSSSPGEYPGLSHIFADETLRFFSLVPVETSSSAIGSPSFNLYTRPSRRRSSSLGGKNATPTATAFATSSILLRHSKIPTSPVTSSDVNSPIGPDWITFSTSGFTDDSSERPPLASTLMEKEKDMEVTIPRPSSPRLNLFSNGRKSFDRPRTPAKAEEPTPSPRAALTPVKTASKSTRVSVIQLDEAFIDFWSDALLDPISSSWPAFIICRLKNTETEVQGKRIEWLVLEQAFKRPPPPLPEASTSSHSHSHESPRHTRPSSPNSNKSDGSFTFSSVFKRFGFFSSPGRATSPLLEHKEGTKKGKGKGKVVGPKVGEMGEILREEDEGKNKVKEEKKKDETVRVRVPSPKPKKSVDVSRKSVDAAVKKGLDEASGTNGVVAGSLAAGAAAVVGGVAVAVATGALEEPEVVKAEEPAPAAEPTTNGALVDSVAPIVLPQEITAPEPVKVTQLEQTTNGSVAAQNGEAPSTVAVATEPKLLSEAGILRSESTERPPVEDSKPAALRPAEEAKAVEPEVVSAVGEVKPTEPDTEPAIEKTKVLESEVVPAIEEAKVPELEVAPAVEEAKVPELEAIPAVEEAKAIEPVVETKVSEAEAVPVVVDNKVLEPEVVPITEAAKVPEPEVPVAEDVKASELEVGSAVEAKAAEPTTEPAIKETEILVPEPEVAPVGEVNPAEPEVASVVEEAKVPEHKVLEHEIVPVVEETKAHEREVPSVVDEVKPTEPEVTSIVEEAKISEPEVVHVEETKKHKPEVALAVDEVKPTEPEVAPIVEETEVPEPEVVQPVNEIKVTEPEVQPVIEEVKIPEPEVTPLIGEAEILEPEVAPAIEEIKAHEPEITPVVDEIKHTEPEVAPAADGIKILEPVVKETVTKTEATSVAEEVKISEPEPAPSHEEAGAARTPVIQAAIPTVLAGDAAILEAQEEVTNETTSKDFLDEPREAVTTVKESLAEPIVESIVPESEQAAQEPQAIIEQTAEPAVEAPQSALEGGSEPLAEATPVEFGTEDATKPVVGETSEPVAADVAEPIVEMKAELATKPVVEETVKLTGEPVVEEVAQPAVAEVTAQEAAAPVVEETVKPVAESVIEEPAQLVITETHQTIEEEAVEPQGVVGETAEETQGSVEAVLPVAEHEAITKEAGEHEPVIEKDVPPSVMMSNDDVFESGVGGIVATEEAHTVPAEKHVEGALVEGGLAPVEAVVIEEEASPKMQDLKTSFDEAPAAVPAIEEESTPVVESVVEKPVVEEETHPVPIVEKPVGSLSALEKAAPEPVERIPVDEEKSALVEPEFVTEKTSPKMAVEVIETSQEEPGVGDAVASEPKPVPRIVEVPFEPTVEPIASEPAVEEQVHTVEESVVQLPVAAVVEDISVVEPTIEDKQNDNPAAEEAVAEESTPVVEDVTESPASIKEEIAPVKDLTPAAEKPETEPSVPIEPEPVPTALDQSAEESPAVVGPDSVPTKEEVTPIVEKSTSSTAENVIEPTEVTSAPEEAVPNPKGPTLSEPDHEPEIKEPTAVEPVPVVADAPKDDTDVLGTSAGVVPGPVEEVVPAVEFRPTTVEFEAEAEAETLAAPAEPVTIAAEQPVEESTDVVNKEEVHVPTEEPVVVDSTPSAAELETSVLTEHTVATVEEPAPPAVPKSEPELEATAITEAEPAPITADRAAEDSTNIVESKETPAPTEAAPIVESTLSTEATAVAVDPPPESTGIVEAKEETLIHTEEAPPIVESTLPATVPEAKVVTTEVELSSVAADEPMKGSTDDVENSEDTPAPATEKAAAVVEEPTPLKPEVAAPAAPTEAEAVPVTADQPAEESAHAVNVESLAPASTEEEATHVVEEPQPEVKPAPIEVQPTSADTGEESTATVDPTDETSVPVSKVTVIEEPTPASVVESESGPETSSPDEAEPASSAAEQPVENTAVADPTETPILTEEVAHVENPTPSAAAKVEPEPKVLAPIEAEHTPTVADGPAEKSPDIIKPAEEISAPTEEQVIASVVEEPAPLTIAEPEPVKVEPILIAPDQPAESITVAESTEKIPVPTEEAVHVEEPTSSAEPEPKPEISAPVEAKSIPTAEDKSNEESTPATHATEQTPALKAEEEEVAATVTEEPVAEEPKPSTGETEPQAEVPSHTEIELTPTAEENVPIIDPKEETPAPILEESAPAVEEPAPKATEHQAEPEQAPAPVEVEPAPPSVNEFAKEKPGVDVEEPTASAEPEHAAIVENVSTPTVDEPAEKTSPIVVEPTESSVPAPATEKVPVPVVEEAKLSTAGPEPVVEAHLPVEFAPATAEEPVEKSTPAVEHASVAEVSVQGVPVVEKETAPVGTTIVEEKPAEIEVTPVVEDATERSGPVDEKSNGMASIDDVVIAENGHGHSAVVKDEEPTTTAASANNHDQRHDGNATSPAEE